MVESKNNVVVIKDKPFYTIGSGILGGIVVIISILLKDYWGHALSLVIIMDIIVSLPFIASVANKTICYEDEEYVDDYLFFIKRRIYYNQMEYFILTQEENTIFMTVYSHQNKKLLKVNMLSKTNVNYIKDKLLDNNVRLRKEKKK